MKVLITTDCYTPTVNGVVTSVMSLQRELTRRGHEVRVLTLSQTAHSYSQIDVTYIGSVGIGKVYPGTRFRSSPAFKHVRSIMEWGPDIIHSQSEFSTFLIARRIAGELGIPIVHTYHTVYEDYTHYFAPNQKLGKRMASGFSRRTIGKTSGVIAPTEKVGAMLSGYGVKRGIHVIPTGIELSKFTKPADTEHLSELKLKYGIPLSNLVLVYVGRLAKEKNVDELISYRASLHRDDVTLLIVGDGPHRFELEKHAESLGITDSVVFTGMVSPESVADYYQLGDLFVGASTSETQGLTYIEALASRLPVLCRKDTCLDGIVRDGSNGWQYENEQEFLEKLAVFADDEQLRNIMSERATQSVDNYSSVAFAAAVENVYLELLLHEGKNKFI